MGELLEISWEGVDAIHDDAPHDVVGDSPEEIT